MSTLGDLLAEHTVLPGNAVDHLHAVVGEWQLLADLSFADFLMWVRRDDERRWCAWPRCAPTPPPTVLLADAVGTADCRAHEMPVVTRRLRLRRDRPESKASAAHRGRSLGLNVEAVPVRYNNRPWSRC